MKRNNKIAIIDADLIARKKHRFPNLACMKISAYHKQMGDEVSLKTDYNNLDEFQMVYVSKVFTDSFISESIFSLDNVVYGGTGFYNETSPVLPNAIEHQMPDYNLYDDWIEVKLSEGVKENEFKFYRDYSIGFLTRGCFRKCGFCVNRHYDEVFKHSPLDEFMDPERDKICMLDDNFLGYTQWKSLLRQLKETNKPFLFKQGLDERLLNDEKCEQLFNCRYDGDYTFAFDNIDDATIIESKIMLARQYSKAILKFYILCGFDRTDNWEHPFWENDIFDTLKRIEILMKHQCIPYIMRYQRYEDSPYRGMYITIARWCNQPNFFKKKSLREFGMLHGKESACIKYLSDFEGIFPEVAYFYDLKYE